MSWITVWTGYNYDEISHEIVNYINMYACYILLFQSMKECDLAMLSSRHP